MWQQAKPAVLQQCPARRRRLAGRGDVGLRRPVSLHRPVPECRRSRDGAVRPASAARRRPVGLRSDRGVFGRRPRLYHLVSAGDRPARLDERQLLGRRHLGPEMVCRRRQEKGDLDGRGGHSAGRTVRPAAPAARHLGHRHPACGAGGRLPVLEHAGRRFGAARRLWIPGVSVAGSSAYGRGRYTILKHAPFRRPTCRADPRLAHASCAGRQRRRQPGNRRPAGSARRVANPAWRPSCHTRPRPWPLSRRRARRVLLGGHGPGDGHGRLSAGAAVRQSRQAMPAGVACTASLATDRPKRGPHRIHAALQTAAPYRRLVAATAKGSPQPGGRGAAGRPAGVERLGRGLRRRERLKLDLLEGEQVEESRTEAPVAWQDLLLGKVESVCIGPTGRPPKIIFAGAFNPLARRPSPHGADRPGTAARAGGLGDLRRSTSTSRRWTTAKSGSGSASFRRSRRSISPGRPRSRRSRGCFPGRRSWWAPTPCGASAARNTTAAARPSASRPPSGLADRGCRFLVFGRKMGGRFRAAGRSRPARGASRPMRRSAAGGVPRRRFVHAHSKGSSMKSSISTDAPCWRKLMLTSSRVSPRRFSTVPSSPAKAPCRTRTR